MILETSVIAYLISASHQDKYVDYILRHVPEGCFNCPVHLKIFKAITDMRNNRIAVGLSSLRSHIKDEKALHAILELFDLYHKDVSIRLNIIDTVNQLLEITYRKNLKDMLMRFVNNLDGVKDSFLESNKLIENIRKDQLIYTVDTEPTSKEVFGSTLRRFEEANVYYVEHGKPFVPGLHTGYTSLDDLGILEDGNLVVIAGRPAMGKTAFVLNIIYNISFVQKIPICFISLEMGVQSITQRLIAIDSKISLRKIRTGRATDEEAFTLRECETSFNSCSVYIKDNLDPSIYKLCSYLREMKQKYGIKLAVIDYLQLLSSSSKESYFVQVGEISKKLKSIARELNMALIAVSQLSRKVEERMDKRPQMSDLRDSGQIEQDADVIIGLYRPGYYNKETDPTYMEASILKNRNGPTRICKLSFSLDSGRITESLF